MPTNLKDEILQNIRAKQLQATQDCQPQWNGYAYVRKRNPHPIDKFLQACKPIPQEKQTDAYQLLKRFYKINQFTLPQSAKLYRIPHLQGNSFFAFAYYQAFFVTMERGSTNIIHHAHLRYQSTTKQIYWIASARVDWEWDLLPKGRNELREKIMRLVNCKKFQVASHIEERIIEK